MKKREKFISRCCVCLKTREKEGFEIKGKPKMKKWDHHDLTDCYDFYDVTLTHGFCDKCIDKKEKELELA